MKLKTFISFLLLSNVFLLSAQNVYYWTDNNKRYLTANELKRFVLVDSQDTSVAQRFVEHWNLTHETGVFVVLEEPVSWVSQNGHKITQRASFWAGEPTTEQLNIASKGGIFHDPNYYIVEGSFPKSYKKGSFQQVI